MKNFLLLKLKLRNDESGTKWLFRRLCYKINDQEVKVPVYISTMIYALSVPDGERYFLKLW